MSDNIRAEDTARGSDARKQLEEKRKRQLKQDRKDRKKAERKRARERALQRSGLPARFDPAYALPFVIASLLPVLLFNGVSAIPECFWPGSILPHHAATRVDMFSWVFMGASIVLMLLLDFLPRAVGAALAIAYGVGMLVYYAMAYGLHSMLEGIAFPSRIIHACVFPGLELDANMTQIIPVSTWLLYGSMVGVMLFTTACSRWFSSWELKPLRWVLSILTAAAGMSMLLWLFSPSNELGGTSPVNSILDACKIVFGQAANDATSGFSTEYSRQVISTNMTVAATNVGYFLAMIAAAVIAASSPFTRNLREKADYVNDRLMQIYGGLMLFGVVQSGIFYSYSLPTHDTSQTLMIAGWGLAIIKSSLLWIYMPLFFCHALTNLMNRVPRP